MEQTQNTGAGKGMSVAGFVISLVAVALWIIVAGIAYVSAALGGGMGLACFWLLVSLAGFILSFMGMRQAGMGGGKKGLGTAGIVLGIIAVLLSAWMVYNVTVIHSTVGDLGKNMNDAFDQLKNGMQDALDSLKHTADSLSH